MNKQVADAKVFGIQGFCKVSSFNSLLKIKKLSYNIFTLM